MIEGEMRTVPAIDHPRWFRDLQFWSLLTTTLGFARPAIRQEWQHDMTWFQFVELLAWVCFGVCLWVHIRKRRQPQLPAHPSHRTAFYWATAAGLMGAGASLVFVSDKCSISHIALLGAILYAAGCTIAYVRIERGRDALVVESEAGATRS